jgi:hypothetical protein
LRCKRGAHVAASQRDRGSEVPSCAVAAHGKTIWVTAKLVDLSRRPSCRGKAIVERAGKRSLRRPSVVHADHHRFKLNCKRAGEAIMRG